MNVLAGVRLPRVLLECWKGALVIVVVAFAANLFTLVNPGFFSHDEWQRLDHIHAHGFSSFVQSYGALKAGPDFGYPVRPIGFLHQGFSALFMERSAFVAHFLDIVLHALCALTLWWALRASPLRGRHALVAALVFAVSPLATFSTAWVGASFDRLYVLFTLVALGGVVRVGYIGARPVYFALIVVGAICAMLSKETAIMVPSALLLAMVAIRLGGGSRIRGSTAIGILAVASLPVIAYLWIRLPALQATFGGHAGAYDPSKGSVAQNAFLYFAQPFLVPAVELVSAVFIPKWMWFVAAALHAIMVLALICKRGIWTGLLYLAGYFVFLLPVMPVSIVGAHYLYGSGVVFAVGMSLLLPPPAFGRVWLERACQALFWLLLAISVVHSAYIQYAMYRAGVCQTVLLHTLDVHVEEGVAEGRKSILIVPDPGALGYVAVRSTFGRRPYSTEAGLPVKVEENAGPVADPEIMPLRMDTQCRVVRR